MNFRKLYIIPALCAVLQASAQSVLLEGTCHDNTLKGVKLFVAPMSATNGVPMEQTTDGKQFKGTIPVAADGFYQLYGNDSVRQIILPLYLPEADHTYTMEIYTDDQCPKVRLDADNQALSAFNAVTYANGKKLWTNGQVMTADQIRGLLKGYIEAADSLIQVYNCSAPVKQYLSLWAYASVYGNYDMLPRITRQAGSRPFPLSDLMPEPAVVFNHPMAVYFPMAMQAILRSLPARTSLDERLAALRARYEHDVILRKAENSLIDGYIMRFDYNSHFDEGLKELETVTEKYGLDEGYIRKFKLRRATVKGANFPENVTLTDVDGNKVDFSSFKGRYVYIDLWASWCVPCCREVPQLQQLEKELDNKDVVFLSISIDKKEEAWKAKMKALNMHGNQLLNSDNSLCEMLNVTGIPFFLIYDKEGKLYMYDAPRPGNVDKTKSLLESLK